MALFGAEDPPPVEFASPSGPGGSPVLLLCDHASHRVPCCLGRLGLDETSLRRHIGWDIGAAAVTRQLVELLGTPAILTAYSRLVIDCNRDLGVPSSIPEESDGVAIPGNRCLGAAERQAREVGCFVPYHAAIAQALAGFAERGVVPAIVSIHSFTPVMNGVERPWQVGILWNRDPRIAVPLIEGLRQDPALTVGDNEPYSARLPVGLTLRRHAAPAGLPHVMVELRQDQIAEPEGAAAWAERVAGVLRPILADPGLYRVLAPAP
jgi:predicted N-formylglutamate amidohydrolase